ncbi:MAG: ferrous iron transporter B [Blautia sp.]|nr:ferrous iron transporter B [Blautia sp.]
MGNPNVGKSTVFNVLTGMHQHTGNWCGKTVESAAGFCTCLGCTYYFVDLPGCYALSCRSMEETVSRDYLIQQNPDAVIAICDATCLEHNLNLVLQICSITPHVLLCINLMDEARKKQISIDFSQLKKELKIPVLGITARKRQTRQQICQHLPLALTNNSGPSLYPDRTDSGQEATYIQQAHSICAKAVMQKAPGAQTRDRTLDWLFTGKWTGFPIMLLCLLFLLWLTIAGANYPSVFLNSLFTKLEHILYALLSRTPLSKSLTELLIFGMYRVVSWVVSVMLPPMAIFFPLFTILEDFGYLPRIAFNLDACFERCRTCGKQCLTMLMGLGCNAAGVTGCRIIDSPRERLIAILTNSFVPCNGRFPTILAIFTLFFALDTSSPFLNALWLAFLLTSVLLLGFFMTFLTSRMLSGTLLKGVPSFFTLELPPYRRPQMLQVILRSLSDRTLHVLLRAITSAAPAGLLIWLLANLSISGNSLLYRISDFLDPAGRLLGLDGVILMAFFLGLPANEIIVPVMIMTYTFQTVLTDSQTLQSLSNTLIQNGWTIHTAVSMLLLTLFHWPCATTLLTIKKETCSLKWTAAAFLLPTLTGFSLCFLYTSFIRLFF